MSKEVYSSCNGGAADIGAIVTTAAVLVVFAVPPWRARIPAAVRWAALAAVVSLLLLALARLAAQAAPGWPPAPLALMLATLTYLLTARMRMANRNAAPQPAPAALAAAAICAPATALAAAGFFDASEPLRTRAAVCVLIVFACGYVTSRGLLPAAYRIGATLGVLALLTAGGFTRLPPDSAPGSPYVLLALGLLSFVPIALLTTRRWLKRRAAWLHRPEALLESPSRPTWALVSVVLVHVAIATAAAVAPPAPLTPFALALAAIAAYACLHRYQREPLGVLATLLLIEAVALIPPAWFAAISQMYLVGLGLANLYLLWLARFWQQQLLGHTAWTTSGALIPTIRALADTLSAAAFVASGAFSGAASESLLSDQIARAFAALLFVAAALRTARDAAEGRSDAGLLATAFLMLAAAFPLAHLVAGFLGRSPALGSVVSAAGLGWSLIVWRRAPLGGLDMTAILAAGWLTIVLALLALAIDSPIDIAACVTLTAATATLGIRGGWLSGRRATPAPGPV